MNYDQLGQRIREERLKLGLTQARLAEDVHISDAYIGQIERGERSLSLDTLIRISNRLKVSVDYLLKDSVEFNDENIVNQFKVLIDKQSDAKKRMAIDVVKVMFAHLDEE